MTIVVPAVDPMTGQPIGSPLNRSREEVPTGATVGANLYEMAANSVDQFLNSDSQFLQMHEKLGVLQRYPSVSGLQDNDYPNLSQSGMSGQSLSKCQLSALTTIPLPKGLLDQFSHIQQNCEMGIMAEIGRAWVAIDSYIYLWNYDNGTDVAYYDGLSETILSVGLVAPKEGVFKPHIKYLLVLTTAIEIVLLGITFSTYEDNTDLGDLLLVPEPIFKVPTDNVGMNVIRGTLDGRIFLGGKDGSVYEVVYQAEDGWFSRKCKKVNLSSSALSFLIPSFLNAPKDDVIIGLDLDEKRHILYTLSQSGTIDVFDLGSDGKSNQRVVSKNLNSIVNEASSVAQTIDSMSFRPIVSISAIEETESVYINLIAVTRAGVRLYFTTTSIAAPEGRPYSLTLLHVRLPPGFTASSSPQRPGAVHCSHFKRGTLLMVSSQTENKDQLWTISNDSFAFHSDPMELYSMTLMNSKIWKIAEEVKTIPHKPYHTSVLKNNKVVAIESPLLVTQHMEEPRKFIFLTSQGIHIAFKPRIVDQLLQLLIENQGFDNETVKSFFALHFDAHGCAVALILACGLKSAQEAKVREWATSAFFKYGGDPHQMTGQQQTQPTFGAQYASPGFDRSLQQVSTPVTSVNQPLFSTPSSPIQPQSLQSNYLSSSDLMSSLAGATTSAAIAPIAPIQYSNKHNGVYLYFSRIIRPIWSLKTVSSQKTVTTEGPKELLISNICLTEIKLYDNRLTDLRDFLKNNIKFSLNAEQESGRKGLSAFQTMFRASDVYANERYSLYILLKLIEHCIEVLGLWKLLCDHQFHAIAAILPVEKQTQLTGMSFRDLVVDGNEMTTLLASALVRRFIEDNSTTDIINKRLQEVCPSIYKNENALHAKAHELVTKAKTITNPTDRALQLENALNLCQKIGARINLPAVCQLFQSVEWYEAVVDICLLTAQNRDPQNLALHYYRNGEQKEDQNGCFAFGARKECYKLLLDIYEQLVERSKSLLNPRVHDSTQTVLSLEEAKKRSTDMLKHAIQSNDELFHIALYDCLYEHQQSDRLLEIQSPYLESYLKRKTSAFSDSIALMDLLWMYYERNGHFRAAAQILSKLAERRTTEVNLYSRLEYLSRAIVCMKSSDSRPTSLFGDTVGSSAGELLHELEEKMEVARIQLQLLQHIDRLSKSLQTDEAMTALNCDLLDITQLYEEFADRFNAPECQLAILHCAGHYDPSLIEAVWLNIIDTELRAVSSKPFEAQKSSICIKIKELGKIYLGSEKYFPIEFIVKYLETKTSNSDFDSQWLIQTLLELEIQLSDLVDLYHKLYKSRELGSCWPRKQIHLVRALAFLIDLFTRDQTLVSSSQRRHFCTKCLDVLSTYLIDLQTLDSEDRVVKNLLYDLKAIKARVERSI